MKTDTKTTKINREIRRQRALERLGSNNPRCIRCGEDYPHALENHHLAGRKNLDEQVIVCRNCHRKLSDRQKEHPNQQTIPPNRFEVIGRFLLGLADLFEMLMENLKSFGLQLIEFAAEYVLKSEESRP